MSQERRYPKDYQLTRRALSGAKGARLEFVGRMGCIPAILRSMQRTGRFRQEDLEEVTQLTLTAIWTKLGRYDGRCKLETWAYGFCLNELRKWRAGAEVGRRRLAEESLESAESKAVWDRSPQDLTHVRDALESLGPPTTAIIRSKHFEGLTFQEIGARLGLSPNSAKTYYYRGLKKLRTKLEPTWRREHA